MNAARRVSPARRYSLNNRLFAGSDHHCRVPGKPLELGLGRRLSCGIDDAVTDSCEALRVWVDF